MPKSEDISDSQEDPDFSESKLSEDEQPVFERRTSPDQRQRNMTNYVAKTNKISGTYGRIIPRKPVHDYEQLYAENMQLKEKIRNIEDMFVKTKTRLSMLEK